MKSQKIINWCTEILNNCIFAKFDSQENRIAIVYNNEEHLFQKKLNSLLSENDQSKIFINKIYPTEVIFEIIENCQICMNMSEFMKIVDVYDLEVIISSIKHSFIKFNKKYKKYEFNTIYIQEKQNINKTITLVTSQNFKIIDYKL